MILVEFIYDEMSQHSHEMYCYSFNPTNKLAKQVEPTTSTDVDVQKRAKKIFFSNLRGNNS